MNQWAVKVGCPVNMCQAKFCKAERAKDCALRLAFVERVATLKLRAKQLKGSPVLREQVIEQLRKMGVTDYDS